METKTIAQRLTLAEARVQQGDAMISRQRTLVRHLQRHGLGIFHASRLLKQLEDNQAGFIAERDQLEIEMALAAADLATVHTEEEVPLSLTGWASV
jgi:hypothetical protein